MRILLLALLFFGGASVAQAQSYHPDGDQGAAYAHCKANQAESIALGTTARPRQVPSDGGCRVVSADRYRCSYATNGFANGPINQEAFCGTNYDHGYTTSCAARGPLTGGMSIVGPSGTSCTNGCVYGIGGGGLAVTVGSKTYSNMSGAKPTGAVCSGGEAAPQAVTQDDCTTIGNLTQCVTSSGKHCAVSSTGRKFCWTPGETGAKASGNEAATKSPQGVTINPPAKPPANGGQWQETATGTATVNGSGGSTTYNVTNHTSNYGAEGEGGGAEGEGDGEGEGDEGQPEWTKGEEPAREDAGEDDDVTDFGIGISPDLLDREEIFGGGSCPTFPSFQIMGVSVSPSSDIPQWCTLVAIMRAAVLIMAAFAALSILTGGKL